MRQKRLLLKPTRLYRDPDLVGYQDPSYFTKVFKKREGVTPTVPPLGWTGECGRLECGWAGLSGAHDESIRLDGGMLASRGCAAAGISRSR